MREGRLIDRKIHYDFIEIGTVEHDIRRFTDRNISVGNMYSYRIRAFKNEIFSIPSNIFSVRVPEPDVHSPKPHHKTPHSSKNDDIQENFK